MNFKHLSRSASLALFVLLWSTPALAQELPRVRLLHPQPGMQFYVDRIEVAGDIPAGTYFYLNDTLMLPDSEGRFRHMVELVGSTISIRLEECRGSDIFLDTLQVFHRLPDHLQGDSVFINNNIPEKLEIQELYPRNGRFTGEAVSLRGKTHPLATLLLNGDTVQVFPSGAFTRFVQVPPGENVYQFTAMLNGTTVSSSVTLSRPLPKPPLTQLDPTSALPRRETWVMAGDDLGVGVSGPPFQQAQYRVKGVTGWRSLHEEQPGRYVANLNLNDIDHETRTVIQYRVGIFSRRIKSAPLRILVEPLGGMTRDPDSRVYDTADSEQLFFPLADSVSLQIIGLYDRMYKIRLGQHRSGYIYSSKVSLDPGSRLTRPLLLGSLSSENRGDWVIFKLPSGARRLPFECKEKALPGRLELKVYGAKQGWEWTTYPDSNSTIAYLERSQPEDLIWQLDIFPQNRFWGWFARYEGNDLVIGVRKAPVIDPLQPFANIRIEIDPGHGGWERGARGITGYAEADANLRYSLKLEKLLVDAGAEVFMTRRDDHQLSLPQRAEQARQDSVHIFVMAHNNAPGAARDIMLAHGASTYYTWPSSKALCDAVYPHLGNMGIATSGEVVRYYYYLTRQTEYLVYLIEGAFMTYPPEEMFLMSEEGLDTLAMAVYRGLEDFLASQAQQ